MLRNVLKLSSVNLSFTKSLKISSPALTSPNTTLIRRFYSSNNSSKDDIRFVYVQNPLRWLRARMEILKLQVTWDHGFKTKDFLHGSTQAVVLFTQAIKENNLDTIRYLTTDKGYDLISRDMFISKNDPRVKLISFRYKDIKRTVPHRVHFRQSVDGKRHCFVDIFAVGLRGVQEIDDSERPIFMLNLRRLAQMDKHNNWINNTADAYILAEVFTRFYRDYGLKGVDEWQVDFYKVTSFHVILVKPNV